MINAWHLAWIIPVAISVGVSFMAAFVVAGRHKSDD